MESVRQLAERLVALMYPEIQGEERGLMLTTVERHLSWFLDDTFKLINNINNTSTDLLDRTTRIIEMEKVYGIPKTHIL